MEKIDRIIQIIHNLREEGMSTSGAGPTNSTNKPGQPVTISGLPPDSPPVSPKKKRNIYLGMGSRKRWMKPKP